MSTTITKYDHLSELLTNALVDLDAATIKVALVTSSYTFDASHTEWADASANEVANGNGYTTGGRPWRMRRSPGAAARPSSTPPM